MLQRLFSSTVRADILALLLNNPNEKFYVREIANILRKNPSGVKRELDNLEKMGILVSERVANLRYFQANTNSPFFPELRNLITKSLGLPGALKSVLRASGVKAAFITGPYAEGLASDSIDLFVIGGAASLKESFENIEKEFKVSINIRQVSEADFRKMKKQMTEEMKKITKGKKMILFGRI
jgi:DNA-binding transcriptional ArsR family regulator